MEEDDQHLDAAAGRRPDGRAAAAAAAADPVPARRHARALRGVRRPGCTPIPTFMAANAELLRDGLASGLTAPRIVTERTIAQIERMLAVPIDQAIVPSMVKVASEADRERIREIVRDVVVPGGRRRSSRRFAASTCYASREEPGIWSAPDGDAIYRTAIRSWTTLELDPAEVHRIGLEELESIEEERREIAPRRRVRRRHGRLSRRPRRRPARTPRRPRPSSSTAPTEDIERAMAIAPRYFGVLPKAACEVRAVEEYKERDAPFAYYFPPARRRLAAGDLLRQRLRPAEPQVLEARARRRTTRRSPATTSRSPSRWRTRNLNPFRRLGVAQRRRGLCRGLGPLQRAPRRRDGPLPQRGRALRDARRPGVARGPARRRHRIARAALAAPALDRLPPLGRPVRDGRRHRDRPLHLLARPGPDLQDRPARDRAAAPRDRARATGRRSTCAAFHDAVLGHGSLPLATLARELPTGWPPRPDEPPRTGLDDR